MELAFDSLAKAFGFNSLKNSNMAAWVAQKVSQGSLIGVWQDHQFIVMGNPKNSSEALSRWKEDLKTVDDQTAVPFIDSLWLAMSLFSEGDLDVLICGEEAIEYPSVARQINLHLIAAANESSKSDAGSKAIRALPEYGSIESDAFLLNLMGKLYSFEKNYAMAGEAFRKSATLSPEFGEAYSNLGTLLWGHGQKKEAFFLFTESMLRNPYTTTAQLNFFDSGYDLKEYGVMAKIVEEILPRVTH